MKSAKIFLWIELTRRRLPSLKFSQCILLSRYWKKIKSNNIQSLHVPAAYTDTLQPFDVAVNYNYLKSFFHQLYAEQVFKSLDENDDDIAQIDLKPVSDTSL